jgi:hypothetical protein
MRATWFRLMVEASFGRRAPVQGSFAEPFGCRSQGIESRRCWAEWRGQEDPRVTPPVLDVVCYVANSQAIQG